MHQLGAIILNKEALSFANIDMHKSLNAANCFHHGIYMHRVKLTLLIRMGKSEFGQHCLK